MCLPAHLYRCCDSVSPDTAASRHLQVSENFIHFKGMQQCDILEDMLIDFIAERHSLAWGLIYKRLHKEGVRHILSKLWDLY